MMVDCVCGVRHQADRERLAEPLVIAGKSYAIIGLLREIAAGVFFHAPDQVKNGAP